MTQKKPTPSAQKKEVYPVNYDEDKEVTMLGWLNSAFTKQQTRSATVQN